MELGRELRALAVVSGMKRLEPGAFEQVGRDLESQAVVRLLSSNLQYCLNSFALDRLLQEAQRVCPADYEAAGLVEASAIWADICVKHKMAAEAVLAHPFFGTWLAHCSRLVREAESGSLAVDLAYFGSIVAAACLRVGRMFRLNLPVHEGRLIFPTLGRLSLASYTGTRIVKAEWCTEWLWLENMARPMPFGGDFRVRSHYWEPVRRVLAEADGLRLTLVLDDQDPYRSSDERTEFDRLDDEKLHVWQELAQEAWSLLVRCDREAAVRVQGTLRTLVPLVSRSATEGLSSSSRLAYGATTLTRPVDGFAMAVALVHESAHNLLNALLVMHLLHNDAKVVWRGYAPWRNDARPLAGLLHGVRAFYAQLTFWRRLMGVLQRSTNRSDEDESMLRRARYSFARWLRATREAADEALGCGRLTAAGRGFVLEMRNVLDEWAAQAVPDEFSSVVEDITMNHWCMWQLHNYRVASNESLRALAEAWEFQALPPPGVEIELLAAAPEVRQLDREHWLQLSVWVPESWPEAMPVAESALARGHYEQAMDLFLAEWNACPYDARVLSGLVLACSHIPAKAQLALGLRRNLVVISSLCKYWYTERPETIIPSLERLVYWLDR